MEEELSIELEDILMAPMPGGPDEQEQERRDQRDETLLLREQIDSAADHRVSACRRYICLFVGLALATLIAGLVFREYTWGFVCCASFLVAWANYQQHPFRVKEFRRHHLTMI